MKSSKQFTVITPVYNRQDCIGKCIDSVLAQEFVNYEMIIIDDGSDDETCKIIERYAANNERLKIITYHNNKGVNYARNRGIEQAQGEFIIFLDSDDQLVLGALCKINEYIQNNVGYSHYLFAVSDRLNEERLPHTIHEFCYTDWLSGRITGDFSHVIKPECFDGLLFPESFRSYESLNWLRVLRNNKKQLYIPYVTSIIERRRFDSLTKELRLDTNTALNNTYAYILQYSNWYSNDYIDRKLNAKLSTLLVKGIILGIAIHEFANNKILLNTLKLVAPYRSKGLNLINNILFSHLIYFSIIIKSRVTHWKAN